MKKIIALLLALVLCLGMFTACGNTEEPEKTTQPPTPDDGILRVLLIGHSLGNDSIWLLPTVAKNEGYKDMVIGMLYYSGCRLKQHVNFLTNNDAVYVYRQWDVSKDGDWQMLDKTGAYYAGGIGADTSKFDEEVTMKAALEQQDWDLVVLQGGVMEVAGKTSDGELNLKDIQTIMDYTNENDIDKTTKAKFAFNVTWTLNSDDSVLGDYYYGLLHGNFKDSQEMFEAICTTMKDTVEPNFEWAHMIPVGTAMQNAHSSYLGNGIYRDYAHASDFGQVIAAYTWLSTLTGKDISEMKFGPIPGRCLRGAPYAGTTLSWTLNDAEKALVLESIGNAMKTPYAMTQSAYTEAPAQ